MIQELIEMKKIINMNIEKEKMMDIIVQNFMVK
jgi:hypothetical protein